MSVWTRQGGNIILKRRLPSEFSERVLFRVCRKNVFLLECGNIILKRRLPSEFLLSPPENIVVDP